ncbi:MAG: thiamine-phosphate kinase, partial [Proteobacteria bacterium]|nr:thiamine-phosphate kinase [Pseudomonadota bacterium]
ETSGKLVVTTDAIVEGVHFLADDPIETVAKKALRVNISDLVAKGVKPTGALLTLLWPDARDAGDMTEFARGLRDDLGAFEVPLLGGDTTATPGPLTVSMTLFGVPLGERVPSRADAKAGEQVWVTGFVGQALLGLRALRDKPDVIGASPGDRAGADIKEIIDQYRTPQPPVAFAAAIARYASASTDVSDGLAADVANIARASRVGIRIHGEAIPLSGAGHAHVSKFGARGLAELVTGGDDYQALFTAAPQHRSAIMAAARAADVNVALIGDVVEGGGVEISTSEGAVLELGALGHRHKLGR